MVIDTSVLAAILFLEPERPALIRAMNAAPHLLISAVSLVEMAAVLLRRGSPEIEAELDSLLERAGVVVIAVDEAQAMIARGAYRRFGRGIHKAGLNLGDCFSYALASATGEQLLFKGNDFGETDIAAASY